MITSNVRKIMENKGITIREMVEQTGLADKTILRARCEQINQCRIYTLETIANFLDCKIKDLFDEIDMLSTNKNSPQLEQMNCPIRTEAEGKRRRA